MHFTRSNAELYVPDGTPESEALARITHLGIGAHQDDLEFMAFHGILSCYDSATEWFGGVTCTNGAGSARTGRYAEKTDAEMQMIRKQEQNQAAEIGRFGIMLQLGHSSADVKDPSGTGLRSDLHKILEATRPRIVYTHNPADKHDTHIGVTIAAIQAMRDLSPELRPREVHGCEVWRSLDWMCDDEKILHDLAGHDSLASALAGVFDSQIAGGKRYDLGVEGRHRANATFFQSHAVDHSDRVAFAMDLTPLVRDPALDITEYVDGFLSRFRSDVLKKLKTRIGGAS